MSNGVSKGASAMINPKFTAGNTVRLISSSHIPKGLGEFKIVRRLPMENGMHGYRVQSLADGHLRVVIESEIA
jgi:hypothetical protein